MREALRSLLLNLLFCWVVAQQPVVTVVDDDAMTYSLGWAEIPGDASKQTGPGSHLSRFAGSTANYTFTGTGISVYGMQGTDNSKPTVSTYSIDGGAPATYTVPNKTNGLEFNVHFYSSPQLENTQHQLVITAKKTDGWLWIDKLQVTALPSSTAPSQTSTSIGSSASPGPSQTSTSVTSSTLSSKTSSGAGSRTSSSRQSTGSHLDIQSQTSSPFSELVSPSSSTSSTTQFTKTSSISSGTIAGIAIGGLLALVALLTLAVIWRRRRRNAAVHLPEEKNITPYSAPFSASLPQGSSVALLDTEAESPAPQHFGASSKGLMHMSESAPHGTTSTTIQGSSSTSEGGSTSYGESSSHGHSSGPRHSTDGGVRIAGGLPGSELDDELSQGDQDEVLPPIYSRY